MAITFDGVVYDGPFDAVAPAGVPASTPAAPVTLEILAITTNATDPVVFHDGDRTGSRYASCHPSNPVILLFGGGIGPTWQVQAYLFPVLFPYAPGDTIVSCAAGGVNVRIRQFTGVKQGMALIDILNGSGFGFTNNHPGINSRPGHPASDGGLWVNDGGGGAILTYDGAGGDVLILGQSGITDIGDYFQAGVCGPRTASGGGGNPTLLRDPTVNLAPGVTSFPFSDVYQTSAAVTVPDTGFPSVTGTEAFADGYQIVSGAGTYVLDTQWPFGAFLSAFQLFPPGCVNIYNALGETLFGTFGTALSEGPGLPFCTPARSCGCSRGSSSVHPPASRTPASHCI